jgi:hypothetical protein
MLVAARRQHRGHLLKLLLGTRAWRPRACPEALEAYGVTVTMPGASRGSLTSRPSPSAPRSLLPQA